MISAVRCRPDGSLEETQALAFIGPWLGEPEGRLWVDICGPALEEMEEVARR